jgi:hypothetical protein
MSESLFAAQTPSGANNSDGGASGITTATGIRFSVSGTVTAIRFYATSTVSGNYVGELWEVQAADSAPAGTRVGVTSTVASGSITAGTWNTIALTVPVSVVTGKVYRASINNSAGRYVTTLTFFTADLVSGHLTADANGDDPVLLGALRQGVFRANSASNNYPSTSGNGTCYFVDLLFDAVGVSSTTPTPIVVTTQPKRTAATVLTLRSPSLQDLSTPSPLVVTAQPKRTISTAIVVRSSLEDFRTPPTPAPVVVASQSSPRRAFVFMGHGNDGLHVDPVLSVGTGSPMTSSTRTETFVSQTTEGTFTAQTRGGVL